MSPPDDEDSERRDLAVQMRRLLPCPLNPRSVATEALTFCWQRTWLGPLEVVMAKLLHCRLLTIVIMNLADDDDEDEATKRERKAAIIYTV